jgi:hypothetical protein
MSTEDLEMDLLYPLYLDVPMMVSFLAALENGVTYEENIQRRSGRHEGAAAEVSGAIGLPSLLGLLPFDLRGRLSGGIDTEASEELQLVKRHTEVSLFNKLRASLHDHGMVVTLEEDWNSGASVATGDIVELTGTVSRNPLDELLSIVDRIRIFMPPTPASDQQP